MMLLENDVGSDDDVNDDVTNGKEVLYCNWFVAQLSASLSPSCRLMLYFKYRMAIKEAVDSTLEVNPFLTRTTNLVNTFVKTTNEIAKNTSAGPTSMPPIFIVWQSKTSKNWTLHVLTYCTLSYLASTIGPLGLDLVGIYYAKNFRSNQLTSVELLNSVGWEIICYI